jgi:nucleoid-associated protein YgaU
MSRTVFGLVAIGAAVIAIALAVAWRGKMSEQADIDHAAKPVAPAAPAAPTLPPKEPQSAGSSAPTAAVMAPSFDVARIDPDGRAVIAGRASPGAKIVLLDGGKEIAHGQADARGEWVLLTQEAPLSPGQHELRVVQHLEGRAPVTSEQVVVAVVPAPPTGKAEMPRDQTLVMIAPPGGAAMLVQPPSAAGVPKSGDLQLSTLDYDERGHVTVTGQAAIGATVRVYIDDKLVAEGATGVDGRWRLVPPEAIDIGKHRLRLDRLGADGKPMARLEMPFERLVAAAAGAADNHHLHVVRGDNLWNIARAHYGEGWRYTVIFEANKSQIRDPDLIYPGQIFSLPKIN